MKKILSPRLFFLAVVLASVSATIISAQDTASAFAQNAVSPPPEICTPKAPATPRINGPSIFGVRPQHPFLYHIPATGDRPMEFSADHLPRELRLDSKTGDITGSLPKAGEHIVTLRAINAKGSAKKQFKIVVGETIALTPPMGWNSWNHYGEHVTADLVVANAKAMVDSGLINHGWTYINIDDTWQGKRGGPFNAIQGNEKFPEMKRLCDSVHALGLKIGIYSTPWTTSCANHIGGSAENPQGTWEKPTIRNPWTGKTLPWAIGKYSFAKNDAAQWSAWGVDYLKYDWLPIQYSETKEMSDALRQSGRDIQFSLSSNMSITNAPALSAIANCWRTSRDIKANWNAMIQRGMGEDKWVPYSRPGHWNDPDMLEIGTKETGQPGLTPDEEYTHMTLWCLVSAPLLLGNDLNAMTPFTLSLLENDEVLAVNQDALGKQATCVLTNGSVVVYEKILEDGSRALGFFNLGEQPARQDFSEFSKLGFTGMQHIRDLWRQQDLSDVAAAKGVLPLMIPRHGVLLYKLTTAQ